MSPRPSMWHPEAPLEPRAEAVEEAVRRYRHVVEGWGREWRERYAADLGFERSTVEAMGD